MLAPNTDSSFYLNGRLVDTNALDYQIQSSHNGARIHRQKQAVSNLRMLAYGLVNGWGNMATDEQAEQWLKECS